MLNKRGGTLNKKTLSVWSGRMQQQKKSVTKFGVRDLSIQIVMLVRMTRHFPFPKTCMRLATIATLLATLTKLRPFLERQLLFLVSCSNRQRSLGGRVPDLVSRLVTYAEQVLQP